MRRSILLSLAPSMLVVLLGACEADVVAIDLRLVPDPNLTDETLLLSSVSSFEMIVDAPEGIYDGGEPRALESVELLDVDGDQALELKATFGLTEGGELPLVRLERGGMIADSIELRIDGLTAAPESARFAAGGLNGVTFAGGEVSEASVPFNIRPQYRAPQVTQVVPANGETVNDVKRVFVIFSKRMNPDSVRLPGAIELLDVGGATPKPIAATAIEVQFFPGEGSPTAVEYVVAHTLAESRYEIRVSAAAKDDDGRSLDQAPTIEGDQTFSSHFSSGPLVLSPPTTPLAGACDGCPGECDEQAGGCVIDCPETCGDGLVCDPTWKICTADCRPWGAYGGCPVDRPRCDRQTGTCAP